MRPPGNDELHTMLARQTLDNACAEDAVTP